MYAWCGSFKSQTITSTARSSHYTLVSGEGGGGAGRGVWRRFKNVISLRCHKQSFKNNYFLISKGVQIGLTLCNSARPVEISFDCKSSLCLPLAVLYKQEMTFFREKKKHKKRERERKVKLQPITSWRYGIASTMPVIVTYSLSSCSYNSKQTNKTAIFIYILLSWFGIYLYSLSTLSVSLWNGLLHGRIATQKAGIPRYRLVWPSVVFCRSEQCCSWRLWNLQIARFTLRCRLS